MRHKFPVLTVKKMLKSVSIYGSYRKNKTGVPFFLDHPVVTQTVLGRLTIHLLVANFL